MSGDLVTGCFGKLPAFGDFLRIGQLPVADLIDRWFLGGGIDQGRHRDLVAAFAAAPPVCVLAPHAGRWWGIAVFPSTDAVGRHSPFAVAVGVPGMLVDDEAGILPLLFAPFFQAAMRQHQAGWPQRSDELAAMTRRLATGIDIEAGAEAVVDALETTDHARLWTDLLGSADHPARARVLATAAAPPAPGVRIAPLTHPLHLAFWLLFMQRSAAGTPPALVAIHPGRSAGAIVLTGRPRDEQCFAALWPAAAPQSYLGGLTCLGEEKPSGGTEGFSSALAPGLADGPRTLRDLLHSASNILRTTGRLRAPR